MSIRSKRRSDGSNKHDTDHRGHEVGGHEQPELPAPPELPRQGRRLARGAPSDVGTEQAAPALVGGLVRRLGGVHLVALFPRSRDATRRRSRGGARPAIWPPRPAGATPELTRALSARSSVVVSSADTASIASVSPGPKRSMASRRTSGVTFSAGCRRRSSRSSTSPCSREAAVAREEHPDVHRSLLDRRCRDRSARVEGQERREFQAVGLGEAQQAEVALGAFRGTTERHRGGDALAGRSRVRSPCSVAVSGRDHEAVPALRGSWVERFDAARSRARLAASPATSPGRPRAWPPRNATALPAYSGTTSINPRSSAGSTTSASRRGGRVGPRSPALAVRRRRPRRSSRSRRSRTRRS